MIYRLSLERLRLEALFIAVFAYFPPVTLNFLPAALRAAQACRYLIYSEADFEVFRPAGATRCTDGVKFGTEEGTKGPLLRAKFGPILRAKFQ